MRSYRVKNKQELVNEFGKDWKIVLTPHWNTGYSMDHLLGRPCTTRLNENLTKSILFTNYTMVNGQLVDGKIDFNSGFNVSTWYLDNRVFTNCEPEIEF